MFSTLLDEAKEATQNRFLANAFFPALVFWTLLGIVVALGQGSSLATIVSNWNSQDGTVKLLQAAGLVIWAFLFGRFLDSQSRSILRLFEGYWSFPLGPRLRKHFQFHHQKQLLNLAQQPADPLAYQAIYHDYPPATRLDSVMPTRLGNILKNAELYPQLRYRIDAVLFWPRLFNVFPENYVETFVNVRSTLDLMLVVCLLAFVLALFSALYLLVAGAVWWLLLLCFWGSMAIAWLAYQGAVGAASAYAQQIKAGFDLYRGDLLKRLRIPLPGTVAEEHKIWASLEQYLYRGIPDPDLRYGASAPPPPVAPKPVPSSGPSAATPSIKDVKPLGVWIAAVVVGFGLIAGGVRLWAWLPAWQSSQQTVTIAVPGRTLPVFHQIDASDLMTKTVGYRSWLTDTLQESTQMIGFTTLQPLPKESPVPASALVDSKLVSGSVLLVLDHISTAVSPESIEPGLPVTLYFAGGVCALNPAICPAIENVAILAVTPADGKVGVPTEYSMQLLVAVPNSQVDQFMTSYGRAESVLLGYAAIVAP